jgi:hypothetical protein
MFVVLKGHGFIRAAGVLIILGLYRRRKKSDSVGVLNGHDFRTYP